MYEYLVKVYLYYIFENKEINLHDIIVDYYFLTILGINPQIN